MQQDSRSANGRSRTAANGISAQDKCLLAQVDLVVPRNRRTARNLFGQRLCDKWTKCRRNPLDEASTAVRPRARPHPGCRIAAHMGPSRTRDGLGGEKPQLAVSPPASRVQRGGALGSAAQEQGPAHRVPGPHRVLVAWGALLAWGVLVAWGNRRVTSLGGHVPRRSRPSCQRRPWHRPRPRPRACGRARTTRAPRRGWSRPRAGRAP